jgi:uncharacterized protein YggT (Ycf19 family)
MIITVHITILSSRVMDGSAAQIRDFILTLTRPTLLRIRHVQSVEGRMVFLQGTGLVWRIRGSGGVKSGE